MATVDYSTEGTVSGKLVVLWETLTADDDGAVVVAQAARPLAGCIQFSGTFSAGTVTFQKSNDGVTWYSVYDLDGVEIAAVAAAIFEFSTAALYLRVVADSSITDVDAKMVLRG
ncbi:MAG: hypothetical protein E6Q97_35160 [Desulfurellales bacterium]|nr:MAG: hypothetical protein E6Q97_35160 [Desulfurellales bacterium]